MSDNDSVSHRPSRRTVILSSAIALVVLVVVAFVVVSTVTNSDERRENGAAAGSASARPSPSQPGGYTPAPTSTKTASPSGPVVTPTGTASPGTLSAPLPLAGTAQPLAGVRVSITGLSSVNGKGEGLGEIDGPAIRFTVLIKNDTAEAISLASVVTDVTHGGAATPANELESVRKGFPQTVDRGATATATYTFTLATADRGDVRITVDYHVGVPITVFAGSAPR
jgi:hypothetical protein